MLYDKICRLAKEKKTSIYMLEKNAELSHGSICKWNNNIPSVDKIQKVAKLLGVTLDNMLDGEGATKK